MTTTCMPGMADVLKRYSYFHLLFTGATRRSPALKDPRTSVNADWLG